jgi:hypothetical protein
MQGEAKKSRSFGEFNQPIEMRVLMVHAAWLHCSVATDALIGRFPIGASYQIGRSNSAICVGASESLISPRCFCKVGPRGQCVSTDLSIWCCRQTLGRSGLWIRREFPSSVPRLSSTDLHTFLFDPSLVCLPPTYTPFYSITEGTCTSVIRWYQCTWALGHCRHIST